jgi:hypothetical protein
VASAPHSSRSSSGSRPASRVAAKKAAGAKKGVNPLLIVGAIVVVAGIGFGIYKATAGGGDEGSTVKAEAPAKADPGKSAPAAQSTPKDAAGANEVAKIGLAADPAKAAQAEPTAPVEAPKPAPGSPDAAPPAAATSEPAKPAEPKPEKVYEDVDLTALPEQAPLDGTTAEELEEMKQLLAAYIDPAAGAAGARAGKKLTSKGKAAFPLVLNAFRPLDLTTDEGFRVAELLSRELEALCNGNSIGWKYKHQKNYVNFDKRVVKKWFEGWEKARTDDAYWESITKPRKPGIDPFGNEKTDN